VGRRIVGVKAQLLAMLPSGVLAGTVSKFCEHQQVRRRLIGGKIAVGGKVPPCPAEGVLSIAREFRSDQAIEVVQQDVVSVVARLPGVTIDDLARAETGAGVVDLTIAPV